MVPQVLQEGEGEKEEVVEARAETWLEIPSGGGGRGGGGNWFRHGWGAGPRGMCEGAEGRLNEVWWFFGWIGENGLWRTMRGVVWTSFVWVDLAEKKTGRIMSCDNNHERETLKSWIVQWCGNRNTEFWGGSVEVSYKSVGTKEGFGGWGKGGRRRWINLGPPHHPIQMPCGITDST